MAGCSLIHDQKFSALREDFVSTIKHFYFLMTNDRGELEIVLPYKTQR